MFQEDLKKGEEIEEQFCSILRRIHPTGEVKRGEGQKSHDIVLTLRGHQILYEVKGDFLGSATGNLAIEVRYKGQPSGVSSTLAHYWVQFLNDKFYVFPTFELKEELKLNWSFYKKVQGGDNGDSTLLLLPLSRALNFSFLTIWE